jgi:hypothetical protein
MTYISLGQAAKGWKVGKATLSRAIRDGKISVKEKLEDGTYRLDPAEIARFMEQHRPERSPHAKQAEPRYGTGPDKPPMPDFRVMQAEIKACELEATRRALDDRIGDLKAMLDETRSDRDHWREQAGKVHLLLTDQSDSAAQAMRPTGPAIGAAEERGRSWWRRLVG